MKKVLNILVMPCWFGSVPFSVGKLVFEADVLAEESALRVRLLLLVVVGAAGLESDWSLDLEHFLYQHQHHYHDPPTQLMRQSQHLFSSFQEVNATVSFF